MRKVFNCPDCSLGAVPGLNFAKNGFYVNFYCRFRNSQGSCYNFIGQPIGQALQDHDFPR